MEKKITIMRLMVDLQCHKCYKKVKKVLCKFPEIRDQIYDEKTNMVIIKVVCCSPERIRDKLCCKGGGSIQSIQIFDELKKPEKPQPQPEPEKPKPQPEPEKPKPQPEPEKPKPGPPPKLPPPDDEPPLDEGFPPPSTLTGDPPPDDEPPLHGVPGPPGSSQPASRFLKQPPPVTVLAYPPHAPMTPVGYYGRPMYDSYGGDRSRYYGIHYEFDQNLNAENESVCTII